MDKQNEKMLLHACCGPCSLEPVRLLQERGISPDIFYANSNIFPQEEYERRKDTIAVWAHAEGLSFHEGAYDPKKWGASVNDVAHDDAAPREDRCRACYRQRFEQSAAYAREHGYTHMGTTLSVSPYQFTNAIREELERACEKYGLQCAFEDYSPHYAEATQRSRAMGMYRQNYCGCAYSKAEAEQERAERKKAKELKQQERMRAASAEREAVEQRKAERARYAEKRARQKAILKSIRSTREDG